MTRAADFWPPYRPRRRLGRFYGSVRTGDFDPAIRFQPNVAAGNVRAALYGTLGRHPIFGWF